MIFSSIIFIWGFLPLSLLVYYLSPPKPTIRNAVLILLSMLFYAFGDIRFLIPIIFLALLNYLAGLKLYKSNHSGLRLIISLAGNLSILVFFKYLPLLFPASSFLGHYTLPLGISFFTFQNITYLCDIYKKKILPENNPQNYLLYILFFPQLIAGPIVKYKDIKRYITSRKTTPKIFIDGFYRFSKGLFKKVILAGSLSPLSDAMFSACPTVLPSVYAWLGALAYTFQIYYDFSGYSDMAVGLGKIFGFDFPDNFDHPYLSLSISEFFRRWHITLSSFFKDYVYIPLGGNRKGPARTIINTLIVFILTGLWHGGQLNFVAWGLCNGIIIALEKITYLLVPKRKVWTSRLFLAVRHLITFVIIVSCWVIFRSQSLTSSLMYLKTMYSFSPGLFFGTYFYRFINIKYLFILAFSSFLSGPHLLIYIRARLAPVITKVKTPLSILWFITSSLSLIISSYTPFIYFRF